jgi:hypothetical protein
LFASIGTAPAIEVVGSTGIFPFGTPPPDFFRDRFFLLLLNTSSSSLWLRKDTAGPFLTESTFPPPSVDASTGGSSANSDEVLWRPRRRFFFLLSPRLSDPSSATTSDGGGSDVSEPSPNDGDVLLGGLERFLFFDAAVGEARFDETPGSGIIRNDRPSSLDVVGSKDRPPDDAPPPASLRLPRRRLW